MKPDLPIPLGRLRPVTVDDLDDIVALLHDKQVRRYLCDDTILPRQTVEAIIERSIASDADGLGLWVIDSQEKDGTSGTVGIAGLEPVSEAADVAPAMSGGIEPTIALSPKCWGRGLAGQALAALIGHARQSLGLSRLVATVDEPNTPSHRMMARCGFKEIGRAPGPANDLMLYELALTELDVSNRSPEH